MYRSLVRPLLFRIGPERIHEWSIGQLAHWSSRPFLAALHKLKSANFPRLHTNLCGIPLANPIGLAAGFDKNARVYPVLHRLGFGFAEVGTVTAHGQSGNEKPRLFRLPRDRAIINRMGFNNDGVEVMARRLAAKPSGIPLGGNIGKSKVTPIDEARNDYETSFLKLKPWVDYFVVNVSSPNTPNLRSLQAKEPLTELLTHLSGLNREPRRPIFLKIAPDLNDFQLGDIAQVVCDCAIDGVIATNTTVARTGLMTPANRVAELGAGGLSGAPLRVRATEVLAFLRRELPEPIQLVGVGGIFSGRDALEKICAGASAVQIYTGFVYGGPAMVFHMLRDMDRVLAKVGVAQIQEIIGCAPTPKAFDRLVKRRELA